MKIFLDTAKIEEIEKVRYVIDGLTTNPSLMSKAIQGKDIKLEDYVKNILRLVYGPVSLEVKSVDYKGMVDEAIELYKKYNHVNFPIVIKIPVSTFTGEDSVEHFEGFKAIRKLRGDKIYTNATLVMSLSQAVLAAKAGATYVSPFVGRIDDYVREKLGIKGEKNDYLDAEHVKRLSEEKGINVGGVYSGVDLVKKIISTYKQYSFETKIIGASIRNRRHVEELALAGVDIVTVPYNVLLEMEMHSETIKGRKNFDKDAKGLTY